MVEREGARDSVDSLDVEPTQMPALPSRGAETDTESPHNSNGCPYAGDIFTFKKRFTVHKIILH